MAQKIKREMEGLGYGFFADSPANQIFPIIDKKTADRLSADFKLGFWQKYKEESDVYRICTSWATDEKEVDKFIKMLKK